MIKARFACKQPPVKVTTFDDKNYFQICLNGKKVIVTSEDEEKTTYTEYEYDFNEWSDNFTNVNDVIKSPKDYLDYVPLSMLPEKQRQVTTEERLAELEALREEDAQALQELIMMLGGE